MSLIIGSNTQGALPVIQLKPAAVADDSKFIPIGQKKTQEDVYNYMNGLAESADVHLTECINAYTHLNEYMAKIEYMESNNGDIQITGPKFC